MIDYTELIKYEVDIVYHDDEYIDDKIEWLNLMLYAELFFTSKYNTHIPYLYL